MREWNRSADHGWNMVALLAMVLTGASCATFNLRGKSGAPSAEGPAAAAPKKELHFPNHRVAEAYDNAKANPTSYEHVYGYAKILLGYCMNSLDKSGGATGMAGRMKRRPPSELEGDYVDLVDSALPKVETLLAQGKLTPVQTDNAMAAKAQMLWLRERNSELQSLFDNYLAQRPNAVAVVEWRLDLLWPQKDRAASEGVCKRGREAAKKAEPAERLLLLRVCVLLHPENQSGEDNPEKFADFLPGLDAEERRLYRGRMLQACEQEADAGDAQCTSSTCKCNDRPWDKKYTEHCLDVCKGCRATGKKRHADCNKKWGK